MPMPPSAWGIPRIGTASMANREAQFNCNVKSFVSDAELENPPSRADGIDAATEKALRIYGTELIQEGCILLKMPQVCRRNPRTMLDVRPRAQVAAATGQILFHRFYFKVSFKRYDVDTASMASLFLAAKREETSPGGHDKDGRTTLRIKERINCSHHNCLAYIQIA